MIATMNRERDVRLLPRSEGKGLEGTRRRLLPRSEGTRRRHEFECVLDSTALLFVV